MKAIFNPIALRKAKIVYNFGLTECIRVKKNFTVENFWFIHSYNTIGCHLCRHILSLFKREVQILAILQRGCES